LLWPIFTSILTQKPLEQIELAVVVAVLPLSAENFHKFATAIRLATAKPPKSQRAKEPKNRYPKQNRIQRIHPHHHQHRNFSTWTACQPKSTAKACLQFMRVGLAKKALENKLLGLRSALFLLFVSFFVP